MGEVFVVPSLQPKDIQALAEFLASANTREKEFHLLLEQHPALLGVLGYVRLLSEHPLRKPDIIRMASKHPDRPDFLGARTSDFDRSTLYVDIIELKAATRRVSQKKHPQRLSGVASSAVTQLDDYERQLTGNPMIRQEMNSLGLTIASPRRILIFGRDAEFADRPDQYEEVVRQFSDQGVFHYTADHLLHRAEDLLDQELGRIVRLHAPPEHVKVVMVGKQNWKISVADDQVVAHSFDEIAKEPDLYAWHKRNPGMIYVPAGYRATADQGNVMCCPHCGSENIVSETSYETRSGAVIGDAEDPCIVCEDCGAEDIHVSFKEPQICEPPDISQSKVTVDDNLLRSLRQRVRRFFVK